MTQQALMTREQLQKTLGKLPRISLGHFPTPLDDCTRLSEALGGPRVLIKREDLSGLAFGGNKIRHVEFRIADVIERGFDVLINANAAISNNARINAAACVKAGIRYIYVLPKEEGDIVQGNLLLDKLMGAEIHELETDDNAEVTRYCRDLADKLRAEGHNPWVRQDESFNALSGCIGFLDFTLELSRQLDDRGISRCHVYQVAGNSVIGSSLGSKLLGLPWNVTGVSPYTNENLTGELVERSREVADYLGLPASLEPGELNISMEYVGPAYAALTQECIDAIRLVARTEAIFLDPVYTGKAMSGLIDHIRKGILDSKDTVVFVHSGGTPNLFTYGDSLVK